MTIKSTPLPALLVAAALALTACGSSGEDDGPSRDQFVTAASAICDDVNAQLRELSAATTTQSEIRAALARSIVIMRDGTARLAGVEVPEDLAADYDRLVDLMEQQTDQARKLQPAYAARDEALTTRISTVSQRLSTEANALATSIGLDACVIA
jgi:hypothetical protein